MDFIGIDAVVTGFSGQEYFGYITREQKGEDLLYHFTFDGGFESITLYKVGEKWVYAGGMRVPNEKWIEELGRQIDDALKTDHSVEDDINVKANSADLNNEGSLP